MSIATLAVAVLLLSGMWVMQPVRAQENQADTAMLQDAVGIDAQYSAQLTQLQQAYAEHQELFRQQLEEMSRRLTESQTQAQLLSDQQQTLAQQLQQLQVLRTQRLAEYRSRLEAAHTQYADRAAVINAQLADVQARLAEANAILGR